MEGTINILVLLLHNIEIYSWSKKFCHWKRINVSNHEQSGLKDFWEYVYLAFQLIFFSKKSKEYF